MEKISLSLDAKYYFPSGNRNVRFKKNDITCAVTKLRLQSAQAWLRETRSLVKFEDGDRRSRIVRRISLQFIASSFVLLTSAVTLACVAGVEKGGKLNNYLQARTVTYDSTSLHFLHFH